MQRKFFALGLLIFNILFIGCNGDDEDSLTSDDFMEGVLTSATSQQLEGKWSIVQAEYEGQFIDIPSNFPECGRDFFDFMPEGQYREYIFVDNYQCIPGINMLSWSLSAGVITLSNGSATDMFVITELSSDTLVFKVRADVDSDGGLDVMKLICERYEPPMEMDIYSGTFQWDFTVDNNDKIYLEWDKYQGYNEFVKYEIYRLGDDCDLSDTELIASISDVNQNFFIDEDPPVQNEICYVFKIYTNQGLLGESNPVSVSTDNLYIPPVQLAEPVISNGTIQLNWELYEGYYFSHYEIEVRNYSSGFGGGYQEEIIAEINSLSTNSYLDSNPPYFANPVYVIHAHNIFGDRSSTVIEGENQRSTNFVREEILPFNTISFPVFDPDETILYFYSDGDIYRYNYATKMIESSANLNSSSISTMKIVNTDENGKEIVAISGEIKVYNAENLQYKYDLNTAFFNPEHLAVTENGYWLFTDREKLHSYRRNSNNLTFLSSNDLYNDSFSVSRINVMDIKEGRILIGNHTKPNGLIVGIDANGMLSAPQPIAMNATSQWYNNSLFSEDLKYILNVEDNTMYSTDSYNLVATINQEFFPSGISNNGSLILGTKNNPGTDPEGIHEKKIRTLAYPSMNETVYQSNGYPHFVFQNHLGQIISISKGLLGALGGYSVENDIFIEIIE